MAWLTEKYGHSFVQYVVDCARLQSLREMSCWECSIEQLEAQFECCAR
jgi:hypothetical protein